MGAAVEESQWLHRAVVDGHDAFERVFVRAEDRLLKGDLHIEAQIISPRRAALRAAALTAARDATAALS